ncbi:hypothetical protein [Zhongshania sp.]|jgi:hypothetical protein|uniref:hypothetical protein n=1 Tax=Zhongshania sp. TaxID=1971902 RepID=UPI002A80E647|nr:hypothetical protein [Zhongshania sp.]
MKAGEHNIAISLRLYQVLQPLYLVINKAGIKVEKLSATEHLITVQLRANEQLPRVFPHAELRENRGKSFMQYYYNEECRLVWEASQ